jgi:hypothetical protein
MTTTEAYTGERANAHAPADSSTDTVLRFGDGVGYTAYRMQMPADRALALAARWNACADALARLGPSDGIFHTHAEADAWAILLRAIYGDEAHAAPDAPDHAPGCTCAYCAEPGVLGVDDFGYPDLEADREYE